MQEGRESLSGLEEEESTALVEESTETESTEEVQSDEVPANESARETVARLLKEAKEKPSDGDSNEEAQEAEPKKPSVKAPPGAKKVKDAEGEESTDPKAEEFDPDLNPPDRFNARSKEMFNNLPKGLKREMHRTIRDLEAQATRAVQEARRAEGESRHVMEAISPYMASWGEQGFTASSAIAALAAAQAKLTDPKTSLQTYIKIGRDLGVDFGQLAAVASGQQVQGGGQVSDISQHPEFRAIHQELQQLKSVIGQSQEQAVQGKVQSIVAEMAAVRDEKDLSGRYRFPELHDEDFLERAKPLVSALVRTVPGLSYGDALKRAYYSLKGDFSGASNQLNQAKPSTAHDANQTNRRATTAAVSVRGRIAPVASGGSSQDLPPEALGSARDTVAWALAQMRRGGN